MSTTKKTMTVPYLGPSGRPYHTLSDAQRRGYTGGVLSEQDGLELQMHCSQIAQRVVELQAERVDIRARSAKLLIFRQDTPPDVRDAKMAEVDQLRRRYDAAQRDIESLKGLEFTITEGEPLKLEPF